MFCFSKPWHAGHKRQVRKQETDRFQFERDLFARGVRCLAGVDEAGRGPLAGPVVAAAVILPHEWFKAGVPPALSRLNDSKQLSARVREELFQILAADTHISRAVAVVEAEIIDRINILEATHAAMRQALTALPVRPQHVLVDGLAVRDLGFAQTALVQGDARSYTIAAASIIAKVTRDRLMQEHNARWPQYGFVRHKGYGTAAHLAAIQQHGPCPLHRRSFAPLRQDQATLR